MAHTRLGDVKIRVRDQLALLLAARTAHIITASLIRPAPLLQNIYAALNVEDAALTNMYRTVGRQLTRLEVEEQMLRMLLKRLEQAGGDDAVPAVPGAADDAGGGLSEGVQPLPPNAGEQELEAAAAGPSQGGKPASKKVAAKTPVQRKKPAKEKSAATGKPKPVSNKRQAQQLSGSLAAPIDSPSGSKRNQQQQQQQEQDVAHAGAAPAALQAWQTQRR